MALRIGTERRQIDNGHLRNIGFQSLFIRTDEEVADENGMPCVFGGNASSDGVFMICATDKIFDKQVAPFCMFDKIGKQLVEMFLTHRLVVVPPDIGFGLFCANDKLVFC